MNTKQHLRNRAARITAAGLLATTAACGASRTPAEERAERARSGRGDVVVAAVWPWKAREEIRYGQGMELAVEEVNAAGGIHGRRLRLLREDDHESINEGLLVAQRLAENPDVVAVIGHLHSYVTVPAAAVYDLSGLVMISPTSTDAELTSKGYGRVFRTIYTDQDTGAQMAEYAAGKGFRRVAIHYVRNSYGRALANAFEERAAERGVGIVARASYDAGGGGNTRALQATLRDWKELELDAVFLAGQVPAAGTLIAEARREGLSVPVLGGDAMSSPALITAGGAAVEGTVVSAPFHPDEPRPEVRRFAEAFRKRWGMAPDAGSALGYDAVKLLAHAMARSGSVAPEEVAATLHALQEWQGVTGPITFDRDGNLTTRPLVKMVVQGADFRYLPDGRLALAPAPAAR